MGIEICALLKCPSVLNMDDPRLLAIEAGSPPEVQSVQALFPNRASPKNHQPIWVPMEEIEPEPIPRPEHLSFDIALRTPEHFFLVFGINSVVIYSLKRYYDFVTNPKCQEIFLEAYHSFARLLEATAGVVARDDSPIIVAFFDGCNFEESLRMAASEGGEVADIKDLIKCDEEGYWEGQGFWRFL